jgi:predicted RNA binding protein YcfA (HicA-like mRNA interferase family)
MTARLPAVSAKRLMRALGKAGFVVDRVVGSHYVLAHTDNPALAVTVPYHGNRDLKPGTLRSIIRQAGLSVDELIDLL